MVFPALLAVLTTLAAAQTPAATPACTEPNRLPHVINFAVPTDPPEAVKQKLQATVEVIVRLGDDGSVRVATATKGPLVLRASAEDAARRTTFEAEYRDCAHHGGLYQFAVEYDYTQGKPLPTPSP